MKIKILIILVILIALGAGGFFVYKNILVSMVEKKGGKNSVENLPKESILAAELELPDGYKAEFLLQPNLLSPLLIIRTFDDQLLIAEHYGNRLLRIDPLNAQIDVLYNLPRGGWGGLLSDGADGVYLRIEDKLAHIDGNSVYTIYSNYSNYYMTPAALGPNGEIYGFTEHDVFVLQSKDGKPKTIATGFSNIYDLVRDKEGDLYVSDWDTGTVTRVKPDGTKHLLSSTLNQKDPIDLGFAPNGKLYINDGAGRFSQFDADTGARKRVGWFNFTEGVHPTDFAFLSNGKAYFVDPTNNNILSADFQKENAGIIIKGGGNSYALDVGPDDAVYIGDSIGYPFYIPRILRIQSNKSVEVFADNLDAVLDLSFSKSGNMFVITRSFGENGIISVLLITPERKIKTLAHWAPEVRDLRSISVDPNTGLAIAYDEASSKLISIDENGTVSTLLHSFDFEALTAQFDHAPDGTLYAIETNKKNLDVGPLVERNIIRFDGKSSPVIIADFNHVGCCTAENITIAPDGTIYVLGYKLVSNDMSLWRITDKGEKILLTDKLPIDPLSVAADSKSNIYVANSAGLLRIWK